MDRPNDVTHWSEDHWKWIEKAVHDEAERIKVAARFLPPQGPMPDALTVPSDTIRVIDPADRIEGNDNTLVVNEGEVNQMLETWVEFSLTERQVQQEEELGTAITLATRATNLLARAQDLLIFQGVEAALRQPLFVDRQVRLRIRANDGQFLGNTPNRQEVLAVAVQKERARYSESTASSVAVAYGKLQNLGHYGPYALVLFTSGYADTFEPLNNTLIMPADRIKPLVEKGFYGTGTLPEYSGIFLSLGGNTMDLVTGVPPTVEFLQKDHNGRWRFRVFERFALRLKDPTALVSLDFETVEEFKDRGAKGEVKREDEKPKPIPVPAVEEKKPVPAV